MKKIRVNNNYIWAKAFAKQLVALGVRYACISPGSRSTSLTIAFAEQKNIKCFVNIDERVSGFFALGLAKASGLPVIIVTTSGTATAELYPAIIEAYQQRVPLIICTADRPLELINTGANQTINQWNLYRNHIRWFYSAGSPHMSAWGIQHLQKSAIKAYDISLQKNKGPVHINFPFRKPLEPDSYTDEIEKDVFDLVNSPITYKPLIKEKTQKRESQIKKLAEKIFKTPKGLIVFGPLDYNPDLISNVKNLSKVTGYPVLADGLSHLRFKCSAPDKFIITNYDTFLRSGKFEESHQPEIVLQFGRTFTSTILQKYLERSSTERYIINEYGDLFDPSRKSRSPIKSDPILFCEKLNKFLIEKDLNRKESDWLKYFQSAENLSEKIKLDSLQKVNLKIEQKIITEIISIVPSNTKIMISNSLPVRDFDNFVWKTKKGFKLFFNRGASGIDGMTSTALGIAVIEKPTVLITGDLSFIHDLNSLLAAKKYSIQLIVILINNSGGGIFNSLPVSSNKKLFDEFFKTPHSLNLPSIINSFGLNHYLIKNKTGLQTKLKLAQQKKSLSVLEFRTDPVLSKKSREKLRAETIKKMNKEFAH